MKAIIVLIQQHSESDSYSQEGEQGIRSKSGNARYSEGWDRIFGQPQKEAAKDSKPN